MVSSNMEPNPNNDNSTNIEAFLHGHRVNLEELEQDGDSDAPKKQRKRRRTSKAWGSIGSCSSEFDQVVFRELLSVVIVKHGLPFQFVKFDAIRTCFEFLNSDIQNISRNTAKANILKAYNAERLRIKAMLGEVPGRICFTSDLWTACTTDGYMSLTAHFIDKNWVLQKRLLNITLMPSPLDFVCLKSYYLYGHNGVLRKRCFL
ncbi:hypothetical protein WN943_003522 [Citrus x changshan-huyou]